MEEKYQTEPELLGRLPRVTAWRNNRVRRGMMALGIIEAVLVIWAYSNSMSLGLNQSSHPMFMFPWILAFALFPTLCITLFTLAKQKRLIAEGLPVGAWITDTKFEQWSDRNGRHERCTLYYEFRVDRQLIKSKMISANAAIGNAIEVDDLMTVLYLPDNPRNNMLYSQSYFMVDGSE